MPEPRGDPLASETAGKTACATKNTNAGYNFGECSSKLIGVHIRHGAHPLS